SSPPKAGSAARRPTRSAFRRSRNGTRARERLFLSIMGVEHGTHQIGPIASEDGQSVIELLLSIPLMFSLTMMLVKVNTVAQISIVNQKYARAQALFLTYHSPVFPDLNRQAQMRQAGSDRLIAGVSENVGPEDP